MTDKYILDENNNPVRCDDLLTWGKWFEGKNRQMATTWLDEQGSEVEGLVEEKIHTLVSTIFLGMDHSHDGIGDPVLFETMVFSGPLYHEMMRYASRDEALAGHADMVARAKLAAKRSNLKLIDKVI